MDNEFALDYNEMLMCGVLFRDWDKEQCVCLIVVMKTVF